MGWFNGVSNKSLNDCNADSCKYANCWNAQKYQTALVVRIPRWIPVPVDAPSAMRTKRDFGVTVAMVTAIALAAVGAATAAVAMGTTVNTAAALNEVSEKAIAALDGQTGLSAQLRGGLLIVNQRVDLVQEQIDVLWQLAQLGCEMKMAGLCITSIQYQNYTRAANLSRQLSQYLLGNWSRDFKTKLRELRLTIIAVNSTRVDPGIANSISSWFSVAMDHLKEWAGLSAIGGLMMLLALLGLWLICQNS